MPTYSVSSMHLKFESLTNEYYLAKIAKKITLNKFILVQGGKDHENFKKEIDANQKKYENLIDEAADQISNFVKKTKSENISK